MRTLKLLFKRATLLPALALIFATIVCIGLIVSRAVITGNSRYWYLIVNVLLAWLPLCFALLTRANYLTRKANSDRADWKFFALFGAWLLFFPNASYICTDLVHLTNRFIQYFWLDLAVILSAAFTGLILGFVSLYLMQSLVAQRLGKTIGWSFVFCVSAVSSFGVYLGRFLRFNSWHVVTKPDELLHGMNSAVHSLFSEPRLFAFLALFTIFTFTAYVILYAMAHMPTAMQLERELRQDKTTRAPSGETFSGTEAPAAIPLNASTAFQDS